MADFYRANRRFERFLFLTPHDVDKDKCKNKLIATVTFDYDKGEIKIVRQDEKKR